MFSIPGLHPHAFHLTRGNWPRLVFFQVSKKCTCVQHQANLKLIFGHSDCLLNHKINGTVRLDLSLVDIYLIVTVVLVVASTFPSFHDCRHFHIYPLISHLWHRFVLIQEYNRALVSYNVQEIVREWFSSVYAKSNRILADQSAVLPTIIYAVYDLLSALQVEVVFIIHSKSQQNKRQLLRPNYAAAALFMIYNKPHLAHYYNY